MLILPPTLRWVGDEHGLLELLDQTQLPARRVLLEHHDLAGVIDSIRRLAVRGAPAIGVAAGYAIVLGVREAGDCGSAAEFRERLDGVVARVVSARPTAVNLAWAADRMRRIGHVTPTIAALLAEARAIHAEDIGRCDAMGQHGLPLIRDGMTVLTHCNTGRLATAGSGTALAVLFAAQAAGRSFRVIADETRPLLQGARLTALELADAGIPVDLIVDSAAAGLIARGQVDLILTGADRIAANGDVANKVGTYGLALAARAHGVPIWVVAPANTFDLSLATGAAIPIEDRHPDEVLQCAGIPIAPAHVGARNPAFDLTPAALLTGLITDHGRIQPISRETIKLTVG